MLILDYASKKDLKAAIGSRLKYRETSMFGDEYKATGEFVGCNRPHMTGHKREFFAQITMRDGLIWRVS
jgi:hypothetical protein